MAKTPAKTDTKTEVVALAPLEIKAMKLKLVGDAPLICHAWSQKAKQEMLDKQMGKAGAAKKKKAKDPEQDFKDSLYVHPDGGHGFPAVAFKAAAVSACRQGSLKMTVVRGAFHVVGELVKIDGKPTMREDMVRVGSGVADIRYRGEFKTWSCELVIRYNNTLSAEQIVSLFEVAGFSVGIGEWRPEKSPTGGYGLFHVE